MGAWARVPAHVAVVRLQRRTARGSSRRTLEIARISAGGRLERKRVARLRAFEEELGGQAVPLRAVDDALSVRGKACRADRAAAKRELLKARRVGAIRLRGPSRDEARGRGQRGDGQRRREGQLARRASREAAAARRRPMAKAPTAPRGRRRCRAPTGSAPRRSSRGSARRAGRAAAGMLRPVSSSGAGSSFRIALIRRPTSRAAEGPVPRAAARTARRRTRRCRSGRRRAARGPARATCSRRCRHGSGLGAARLRRRLGQRGRRLGPRELGEPEVEDLDAAVVASRRRSRA